MFEKGDSSNRQKMKAAPFGKFYGNICVRGTLSGLRQFLAAENPFKMMKNAFYFTLKAPFVFRIIKFLS